MRLKKRPGQTGAQQELNVWIACGNTGMESFVEWRKKE